METVIFENVDKKKANLLRELALQMGIKTSSNLKTKNKITNPRILKTTKRKQVNDSGIVTNPEILKSIKEYESGKSKLISLKEFEKIALKKLSNA